MMAMYFIAETDIVICKSSFKVKLEEVPTGIYPTRLLSTEDSLVFYISGQIRVFLLD